jgi:hypothetical protein
MARKTIATIALIKKSIILRHTSFCKNGLLPEMAQKGPWHILFDPGASGAPWFSPGEKGGPQKVETKEKRQKANFCIHDRHSRVSANADPNPRGQHIPFQTYFTCHCA